MIDQLVSDELLRVSFSRAEIISKAQQFMRSEYGSPIDKDDEGRDRYHEKLGFLIHFVTDLFPEETK